jgi:hypothetical protein
VIPQARPILAYFLVSANLKLQEEFVSFLLQSWELVSHDHMIFLCIKAAFFKLVAGLGNLGKHKHTSMHMFDSAMYLKGGAMATSIGTAKQLGLLQACFYQPCTSE